MARDSAYYPNPGPSEPTQELAGRLDTLTNVYSSKPPHLAADTLFNSHGARALESYYAVLLRQQE